ncbi:MAG: tRNA methyl transferase PRC-barrel domain-containing protein, partial [Candidatus Paceibacteria bacterium]
IHGDVLGTHQGVQFYTVGQRKGLGLGGGVPYYVISTDQKTNRVYVAAGMNPPELYKESVFLSDMTWTHTPRSEHTWMSARLRHGGELVSCYLDSYNPESQSGYVYFRDPQRAITPGQFLVLYQGEELVGSGIMN